MNATGLSTLTLSNATIQAVPWETDALPVLSSTILFGIGLWTKRKFNTVRSLILKRQEELKP